MPSRQDVSLLERADSAQSDGGLIANFRAAIDAFDWSILNCL
jgi:hypothetical protein